MEWVGSKGRKLVPVQFDLVSRVTATRRSNPSTHLKTTVATDHHKVGTAMYGPKNKFSGSDDT